MDHSRVNEFGFSGDMLDEVQNNKDAPPPAIEAKDDESKKKD